MDIDRLLKEREVEDIAIGNDRIWTITYADNIVLVAKNRVAIQDMIGVLRDFLRRRKLELNGERTKNTIEEGEKKRDMELGKEIRR